MQVKILELFGGIGAPRKALENLITEHKVKEIDYVEIDEYAVMSYNELYRHTKQATSVVGYNLCPDILIHGSPCQDFSVAGFQKGGAKNSETRSSLMFETINIVRQMGEWKPKYIIWENVKGVLNKNNIGAFNHYMEELEELGYKSNYQVLNAKDYGVPQNRERVFCISTLDKPFNFELIETKEMNNINEYLETNVSNKYYLNQPSMLNAIEKGKVKQIKGHCYTITTKQLRWNNAGYIQDKRGKRMLTPRECWRLMGFTDNDFDKLNEVISETQLYKLAGNSIVVPVLESIMQVILKELEEE